MRSKAFAASFFVLGLAFATYSQNDRAGFNSNQQQLMGPQDPMSSIALEVGNISRSVQQLSNRLQAFVDKFEKVGGMTLSEKQQRFIMGLEILVRSEQRVATLQKMHSDLLEKQIQVRTRLTQIEADLRPDNLDRETMYSGAGVHSVEARENRKDKLTAEQRSLQQLAAQVDRNVNEAEFALREAQSHVARLRRSLLPQIEKELGEPF